MHRILFLFIAVSFSLMSNAQVKDPVKWTFTAKKISNDTYEVHLEATIEKGWHIYSQATPEGGPLPTGITFSKNPLLTLSGVVKEIGKLEQHHEPLFGVDVKQYSNKVDFVQTFKVKAGAKTAVKGSVEYMVCDNEKCLPPKTVKFSVSLK
ncbi:MAG TPA: protein-disulfide reductase DsbD domain-containing protein [Chitinophagaceae bacterium]